MRYSLLSRFRGTLLAAAMGEVLSEAASISSPGVPADLLQGRSADLSQLIRLQAENLIQFGDLDLETLHHRWVKHSKAAIADLTPAQVMAGVLPVALFFHEDETRLGQRVSEAIGLWRSPELQVGTLAVAYAIAQALGERLEVTRLIPQTVTYLRQATSKQLSRTPDPLPLIVLLEQVQMHLSAGSGLSRALTQLLRLQSKGATSTLSVALAFYCCLSTLEDFRLSVTRAVYTPQPLLTVLLTAALSGAHNSSAGIPLGWQLFRWESAPAPRQLLASTSLIQLADQLLAAWSGAYKPTNPFCLGISNQSSAVAAPGLIRPR